jgi:hypothetical protein
MTATLTPNLALDPLARRERPHVRLRLLCPGRHAEKDAGGRGHELEKVVTSGGRSEMILMSHYYRTLVVKCGGARRIRRRRAPRAASIGSDEVREKFQAGEAICAAVPF